MNECKHENVRPSRYEVGKSICNDCRHFVWNENNGMGMKPGQIVAYDMDNGWRPIGERKGD